MEKTIEEKAKRYDEAIEVAQRFYNNSVAITKKGLEDIFPELKESEDERIKKFLIQMAQNGHGEDKDWWNKCVAWLEKQGEQNPEWTPTDEQRVENLLAIVEEYGFFPGEVAWLNSLKNRVQPKQGEQKPVWSEKDEKMLDDIIETSTHHCYLNISDINWLKSLKERVQLQPKQEWSDEDEQLYNDLSDTYFYNDEDYPEETYKLMLKRVLDWMTKRAKSLRPQNTWKPSSTDIQVLEDVIDRGINPINYHATLHAILEQLKKLTE